jgi:vacuolar-type H+-ATPase subunit H
VEEKLLEELQNQQSAVKRDANSPLFMIREKEMEISGRVLAAKQEAERLIADARRKAAEMVNRADAEAGATSAEHQTKLLAEADAQVARLHDGLKEEAAPIEEGIRKRRGQAQSAVVDMVTRL